MKRESYPKTGERSIPCISRKVISGWIVKGKIEGGEVRSMRSGDHDE